MDKQCSVWDFNAERKLMKNMAKMAEKSHTENHGAIIEAYLYIYTIYPTDIIQLAYGE